MTTGSIVAFNWGRPNTLPRGIPLAMRIYWTPTRDIGLLWLVRWRWVRAIQSGAGPNPPMTSLGPLSDPLRLEARGFGPQNNQLQLHVTEFLRLESTEFEGEYLIVNITAANVQDNIPVHLLLVELMWEV
jgi:hypothetical protein